MARKRNERLSPGNDAWADCACDPECENFDTYELHTGNCCVRGLDAAYRAGLEEAVRLLKLDGWVAPSRDLAERIGNKGGGQ